MVREVRMHRPSRSGHSAGGDMDVGGSDAPELWDDGQDGAGWNDLFDCDWLDDFGDDVD